MATSRLNGLMGFDMHGKTDRYYRHRKDRQDIDPPLERVGDARIWLTTCIRTMKFARGGRDYLCLFRRAVYSESDIISLHCPLTDQTRYLINDDSIAKMKDGVMIINTGRGLLIHTNDLDRGIEDQESRLPPDLDVYEEEGDYFYEDKSDKIIDDDVLARLLSFNNVIVTSHQAFFTKEALHNIAETTLRNIKDFEEGRPLVNEVTK